MAELATIARPYAEALFKAAAGTASSDGQALSSQLDAVARLMADGQLRRFADNPKVTANQVFDVVQAAATGSGVTLGSQLSNLLRAVIDNGRLAALPEIAAQFKVLVNAGSGISDATIQSPYPIESGQLADVVLTLERRFSRKLNAHVEIVPGLIGGIRVVVGDEVLDTSVKARLEQMKIALTA